MVPTVLADSRSAHWSKRKRRREPQLQMPRKRHFRVGQDVAARKLFACEVATARALKNAAKIEQVKIVKRIKAARQSGDTDRIARLERERSDTKAWHDWQSVARRLIVALLRKYVAKYDAVKILNLKNANDDSRCKDTNDGRKSKNTSDNEVSTFIGGDWSSNVTDDDDIGNFAESLSEAAEKYVGALDVPAEGEAALNRIQSTKAVQDMIKHGIAQVCAALGMDCKIDFERAQTKSVLESRNGTVNSERSENAMSVIDERDSRMQDTNQIHDTQQINDGADYSHESKNESDDEYSSSETESSKFNNVDDPGRHNPTERPARIEKLESTFLPALSHGFIEPENSAEGHYLDQELKQVERKMRNNRRGQRARRAIWEKKYGRRANHIQKVVQEEREKREKQREKMQQKAERRRLRMLAQAYSSGAPARSNIQTVNNAAAATVSRVSKIGNSFAETGVSTTGNAPAVSSIPEVQRDMPKNMVRKSEQTSKPLHPSWQAKKQERLAAHFQGSKISFQ